MSVRPRLTGIFTPKETALQQLLDIKYGRTSPRPLGDIFFEDTLELIKLQLEEGFKLISDGQRSWGDLLRPIYVDKGEFENNSSGKENKTTIKGIKIGSMARWFETNGFCFPPKIVERPLAGSPKVNDYFFREDGKIKATEVTLPGPYTLLRMSQDVPQEYRSELLEAFTTQLQRIVASLPSSITLIEFSEPSIAYDERTRALPEQERRELLQQARKSYQQLYGCTSAKLLLQLPQGNFLRFPEVLDFAVDGFGVDLTETVDFKAIDFSSKINLRGKILSAGVVDAWSSNSEDIEYLAKKVDRVINEWQPGEAYVTSNSQLYQTISHQGAIEKLQNIAELARRLS